MNLFLIKVAACISIIMVVATYFYQRSVSTSIHEKLAQLEEEYALQQLLYRDKGAKHEQVEGCTPADSIPIDKSIRPKTERRIKRVPPQNISLTIPDVPVELPETAYPIDTTKIENTLAMETRIEPIIGVVVTPTEKLAKIEKRRKIKILRSIEPFYDGKNKRSTPILARIK